MEITREIVDHPESWTGTRVVEELPVRMYDGDDTAPGQDVPAWLRDVMVLCDFETHLQMEGLLGWWENTSRDDWDVVCAALRSVGMEDQAALLDEVVEALGPGEIDASLEVNSVSSFTQRHPELTDEQLEHCRTIEERLTLEDAKGKDLRSALVAHADSGLAAMQRSG